jgi:cellulose synthase (UDP-forming)
MAADPRLGIVQSPQYFRVLHEQNWIERGAGAVQELFYRSVQVSRQSSDAAICVGTCALYRRAALLENGGTTLIGHSEDVHTGFDLRKLGWDLKYVPIALSAGVCPDNISAFYNQQYRWCMGSMSLLTSKKFWGTKMRLASRFSYFSGFFYYAHTALFTFLAPLLPIALLMFGPQLFKASHLIWLLPGMIYTSVIFPMWHRVPYRLEAWAVRMLYGWAHFFAISDLVRGRQMGWQPTGSGGAKKSKTRRLWIGLVGWSLTSSLLWVGLVLWRIFEYEPTDFALVLGTGIFNLLIVLRAIIEPRAVA